MILTEIHHNVRLTLAELAIWAGDYSFACTVLSTLTRESFDSERVIPRSKVKTKKEKDGKLVQEKPGDEKTEELFVPKNIEQWACFAAEHRLRQLRQAGYKLNPSNYLPEVGYRLEMESRIYLARENNFRFSVRGFLTDISPEGLDTTRQRLKPEPARKSESPSEKGRKGKPVVRVGVMSWGGERGRARGEFRLFSPGAIEGEIVFWGNESDLAFPNDVVELVVALRSRLETAR